MKRPMTIATILIVLLMWMTVSIQAQTEQTWIVSTDGDYSTIEEALLVATDGDTIEVYGGTHAPFIVEKSVRLIGVNNPVVDGEGEGTVVLRQQRLEVVEAVACAADQLPIAKKAGIVVPDWSSFMAPLYRTQSS